MIRNTSAWIVIGTALIGPILLWHFIARTSLVGDAYLLCMALATLGALLFTLLGIQHIAQGRTSTFVRVVAVICGVILPLIVLVLGNRAATTRGSTPATATSSTSYSWPDLEPAAVAAPVAAAPVVKKHTPSPNWREEWVRLMDAQVNASFKELARHGAAGTVRLEDIQPISTVIVQPGEVRFVGQTLDASQKSHVWLSFAGDGKNLEFCGSVLQNKWVTLNRNPSRGASEPGADALLVRAKPSVTTPITITAERVVKNGQRDRSDLATPPAVRKIYRNVIGKQPMGIAKEIITELHGQRVDSTMLIVLLANDGLALDPASGYGSFTVGLDGNSTVSNLRFDGSTVGRNNPALLVAPNQDGLYDIVVVLTPL